LANTKGRGWTYEFAVRRIELMKQAPDPNSYVHPRPFVFACWWIYATGMPESKNVEVVAGNGLLHRRAFLRGGAVLAGAVKGYTLVQSASAQQLTDDPWSLAPGATVPDYGTRSRFEKGVVRTLSNPKAEPRTQHARTPHHLLNGTLTPNSLHFVISHTGDPDIDPDKHRLVIHGLVKQPLSFTLDALARYPMVSRMAFIECGGNSAPLFSKEPIQANVQALHGLVSCAEWTGIKLATLLEETGIDPKAKWLIAEGADASHLSRSVPLTKGLDDAMIALYQNGERLMPGNGYPMAIAFAWLGRQHEHQMAAANRAYRTAQHELLRIQDLRPDPAGREGVPILFPPGGQILHYPPVAWACDEGPRILRDFRPRLFRQRADLKGYGIRRWRPHVGAGGTSGAGS